MRQSEAQVFRFKIERAAELQDDATALDSVELYPLWKVGILAVLSKRYQYDGKLYRCIQEHTTQESWTPDITPALWTEVSVEEWPEWRQPLGSEDAYRLGDKVSHNEKHWISNIDYNIYEPGVYGWTEQ